MLLSRSTSHPLLGTLALGLLAALPAANAAPVTFTFNVTAQTNHLGYVQGDSYVFSFTTGPAFADNASSSFDSTTNFWEEERSDEDRLFVQVTGSGLGGTLSRPSGGLFDPNSYIETYQDYVTFGSGIDGLFLGVEADITDIGLTTNGGASLIRRLSVRLDETGTSFAYPGSYVAPNDFFAAETGAFSVASIPLLSRSLTLGTVSDGQIVFTIESFSITAVPEPSAAALLAGLGGLGCAILRRPGRRTAPTREIR